LTTCSRPFARGVGRRCCRPGARFVKRRQEEQRDAQRVAVLAHLDHLSAEEIRYIADSLRKESPTFYTYVHSPPVAMLGGIRTLLDPR
jgi:hypothetical protein